jgi:hypothetical protein
MGTFVRKVHSGYYDLSQKLNNCNSISPHVKLIQAQNIIFLSEIHLFNNLKVVLFIEAFIIE